MRAGLLRHKVQIERPASGRDGWNERVDGWEPVATVDARIEQLQGRELLEARALESRTSHRITFRYSSTVVDGTMRFLWNDRGRLRTFNALGRPVENDSRRRSVQVMVEEVG